MLEKSCDATFSTLSNLNQHLSAAVHLGLKPHAAARLQPLDSIFMETLQIYKSTNMHIPPFISTPLYFCAKIFII